MLGLARALRWCSVAWLIVAAAAPLLAQEPAGRIEGTVMDPAGSPLAGVQVTLVGSAFRALSAVRGAYSMDHVPAGAYTLRVQFAAYPTTDVTAVRVHAGEIVVIDVRMGQAALAPPPALVRGFTTSRTVIEGSSFSDLPVTDARDVLALQPGVFPTADQTGFSIHGGAAARRAGARLRDGRRRHGRASAQNMGRPQHRHCPRGASPLRAVQRILRS